MLYIHHKRHWLLGLLIVLGLLMTTIVQVKGQAEHPVPLLEMIPVPKSRDTLFLPIVLK